MCLGDFHDSTKKLVQANIFAILFPYTTSYYCVFSLLCRFCLLVSLNMEKFKTSLFNRDRHLWL